MTENNCSECVHKFECLEKIRLTGDVKCKTESLEKFEREGLDLSDMPLFGACKTEN